MGQRLMADETLLGLPASGALVLTDTWLVNDGGNPREADMQQLWDLIERNRIRYVGLIIFDFTADCATGDGKFFFHVPAGLAGQNLVEVHAECITAGTTGTMDIQIRNVTQAADMLSTLLTIDTGETGSDEAATPAVIDVANDDVAVNDVLAIDVDVIHTTAAKGLITTLGFKLP